MKLFRRSDNDAGTCADGDRFVRLYSAGGLIFAVFTSQRLGLNTIHCKTALVQAIIVAYVVAAFIDALVRRAETLVQ